MALPPAGAHDQLKVFVAYARQDAGFAEQLGAFLQEAGFRLMIDREDLATDNGPEHIATLIAASDVVALVLTDAAARSSACAWEVEEALRLGKRVIRVLPQPLTVGVPPGVETETIRFYVDPTLPQSGFFDGQKRLIEALYAQPMTTLAAPETPKAERSDIKTLQRALKKTREDPPRTAMSQPSYPPPYPYPPLPPVYERPRRRFRFPWLRGGFLVLIGGYVVAFIVSDDVRAGTRSIAAKAATWAEEVNAATEPPPPPAPPGQDYAPTRAASAGAQGANVRSYPLPHATLLTDLPARTALNVNGRINVQGQWWFRVTLPDGRVGFVHQNSIAWGHAVAAAPAPTPVATNEPAAPNAPTRIAGVTLVDPAIAAEAGRAGAKIRTSPARNARVIVRIARGDDVSIVGKRRLSGHWWYRVRLEDGREGYARDDVLTAPGGGRLRV